MRKWKLWQHFSDFFPINLVKTAELDPSRSYLLGSHPHGVLCAGAFCTFATEAMNFSKHFPGTIKQLLYFSVIQKKTFQVINESQLHGQVLPRGS